MPISVDSGSEPAIVSGDEGSDISIEKATDWIRYLFDWRGLPVNKETIEQLGLEQEIRGLVKLRLASMRRRAS